MKTNTLDSNIQKLSRKFQKEFYEKVYPKMNTNSFESTRIICLILIFIAAAFFIYMLVISFAQREFLFILIIGLALISSLYKLLYQIYKSKIKKAYYKDIIEITGLGWQQGTQKSIDAQINNSKLFMHASHIKEDDVISGTYQNVELKISDASIIDAGYKHGNSSEKHTPTTLFKGVFVYFDSNKKIGSTTLIKPKIDLSFMNKGWMYFILLFWALFGALILFGNIAYSIKTGKLPDFTILLIGFAFFAGFGYWFVESSILRELRHLKDLEKVNLESTELSKNYQAFSYDQVEARYLLTTSFIDRFLSVGKAFNSKSLRCAFVGNKIILAIPSFKDSFEIGSLFFPLSNPKAIRSFFNQIASILYLVEYFKLDEKTNI